MCQSKCHAGLNWENQHWNHLIQDAQKRGAIIKTCDKNYRHDAAKILKLKPVLQRSLTHPPAIAPEASRPQGGLLSGKLDSEFAKTSFTSSLYHTASDSKESAGTVTTKDPERPPIQDRLRDPRLLRRLGMDPEARGTCLRDPQPLSPQHLGATPPSGEPGFPMSHQDPGGVPQATTRGATPNNHRPHVQGEPPAAGTDVPTSKRKGDWEAGLSHRRESRAFSEGDQESWSPDSKHSRKNLDWDRRGLEKDDSGSKKRKLL
ncbi:probable helicase senataxin isoform X6 [Vulpes lagopus]|uniref:probable helicase senataxin isoform X6 n=1 Tax=Vulpes lagopus TaxID=494514 RepID=UPI001BC8CE50|nr:probable helicase senataxin isoform X6 [Vulpes lagopus]